MRWSQLKKRVEDNFATSVRGRVELFQTCYRRSMDEFGETWIVLDGNRRFSWGDMSAFHAEGARNLAAARNGITVAEQEWLFEDALTERGVEFRWGIHVLLLQYLSLPIDLSLKDRSPIIRGIAILDRRCGKRRLLSMKIADEHPFVQAMYDFRRVADGIRSLTGQEKGGRPV